MGSTSAKAMSATFRFSFIAPTVTGTYVFRVFITNNSSSTVQSVPQTFTVTVSANASSVADQTYTVAYLNRAAEYTSHSYMVIDPSAVGARTYIESDSSLTTSAGSTLNSSNSAVAIWTPIVKNSTDTKVASVSTIGGAVSNTRVKDSITVTITGPGLIAGSSYWGTGVSSTRAKQVTINWNESVVVYADGNAGTATITGYVGSSVASNVKFAQAAKSITFVGRATTFTVTGGTAATRNGSTVAYINDAGTNESVTAATGIVRFLAKDAAGNNVTIADLSTDQGEAAFYAVSSDTSVLAASPVGRTTSAAVAAARKSPNLSCSYNSTVSTNIGYWQCDGAIYDSGTVTLTIVDSRTVTPNGSNYLTSTTSAVYKSDAFSLTIVGKGYTGTIALDKSTYTVGEAALLTTTCKDASGRIVMDRFNTCFTNLNWFGAEPTFSANTSSQATGGSFTSLKTYLDTSGGTYANTYVGGTDTAMVYMPTLAGTYTLKGRTSGATTDSTLLTFTVTDPVQDAQNAAIAASQKASVAAADAATAAADAATDAALQAIDAANAATDAANLAAEAADAATVAAEEAKDAADAATAAVEALATQVATLMAALQAQVRSLANTVAKIAKKVKA